MRGSRRVQSQLELGYTKVEAWALDGIFKWQVIGSPKCPEELKLPSLESERTVLPAWLLTHTMLSNPVEIMDRTSLGFFRDFMKDLPLRKHGGCGTWFSRSLSKSSHGFDEYRV